MKKTFLFLIIFTGLFMESQAQDFKTIDEETYRMYQQESWDSLIAYYQQNAKPAGIDYYYLRMRVGIAYFSKANYLLASNHFKQALEFDEASPLAGEYLYYSYLNSGRKSMAEHTASRFSDTKKEKLNYSPPAFFENLRLESGINFSRGFSQAGDFDIDGAANIYGEASFTGNTNYYHLGLRHSFLPGFSLFHGVSTFQIDKERHFAYNGILRQFDFQVDQDNYYISPTYVFKNALKLKGAYHIFRVKYQAPEFELGPSGPQYPLINYEMNDYLYYLSASRYFGKINIGLNGSYSEINNFTQQQYGLAFFYYPYGNYKVVLGSKVVWFHQDAGNENAVGSNAQELIIEPSLLYSVSNDLWLKTSFTLGDLYNYHEEEGFVIYNIPDKITTKAELSLNYKITPNLKFDLHYRYLKRKDLYLSYNSLRENDYSYNDYKFDNHYLIGGISWVF